jgi:hypothetical protein
MVKTQIQIPDDLYRDLKRLAKRKEWSLAETLRRGGEQILEMYPDQVTKSPAWEPPAPQKMGWKNLSAEEMHRLAVNDMEPRLP